MELVKSLVQAAKYVSVAPSKAKFPSIGTQTDPPESTPSDSEKVQAVITVDKSTETVEDFTSHSVVPKDDDSKGSVEVKQETVSDKKEHEERIVEDEEEGEDVSEGMYQ